MLISGLFILLLSMAVTLRRDKSILYNRSSINTLIVILLSSLINSKINIIGSGIGLYGGLFHLSNIGQVFHNLIYLISIIIMLLTAFFGRNIPIVSNNNLLKSKKLFVSYTEWVKNKKSEHFKIVEYPLILLFIITGATFLINSSDIVSIFLCIELQSYGL